MTYRIRGKVDYLDNLRIFVFNLVHPCLRVGQAVILKNPVQTFRLLSE
jgi:hypothetical protein